MRPLTRSSTLWLSLSQPERRATSDEIVASLEAVTPVTGAARVVQCAPKVALALGYDVDAALERHDP